MRPVSATYKSPCRKASPCGRWSPSATVTVSTARPGPRSASAITFPWLGIETISVPAGSTASERGGPRPAAKTSAVNPGGGLIGGERSDARQDRSSPATTTVASAPPATAAMTRYFLTRVPPQPNREGRPPGQTAAAAGALL